MDWFNKTWEVIDAVKSAIWAGITYPYKMVALLPSWIKAIILLIIILVTLWMGYHIWKKRDEWRWVSP